MKRESWPVTRPPAQFVPFHTEKGHICPYCKLAVGQEHAPGCVCRKRTVVIRADITMVVQVPEDWDKDGVEFWLNESSSCQSNLLIHIENTINKDTPEHPRCICDATLCHYVREATKEDEERYNHSLNDKP